MTKILVAYATWAGATHEVADFIGKNLSERKFEVTVSAAKDIDSLTKYDAVVLGTSIHASKTVKDFGQFLKCFYAELEDQKPFSVFAVCANMMEDNEKTRTETLEWVEKALSKYPGLEPESVGLFGGAVQTEGEDFNNLNFLIRKLIQSMNENYLKEYGKADFRDWDKIRDWANQLFK